MNVYDFDNTIYDGESSFDFFIFCAKRDKRLLYHFPLIIYKFLKYKLCLISVEELECAAERYACDFFKIMPDLDKVVNDFWDSHMHKIKSFYKKNQREDDIVISASADFLLENVCQRIGIKNLICSKLNRKTGKAESLCFRNNKVDLFYKNFPDSDIDNFYTDSMNDKPMIEISSSAYLVKGNKLKKIK